MTSKVISQDQPIPTASPGFADIVGFGVNGVTFLRNASNPRIFQTVRDFGFNAGGWRTERHVRLLADITGDKNLDIVGFGENGVWICTNNRNNTFTSPPRLVISDFSYSTGWRVDKHIRYLADIRNVGYSDIVGFGDEGVLVSGNNGGGSFSPPTVALADFGYNAGGWRLERHLRFLADVTGDGRLDIIGFGENSVLVGRNNGSGTFAPVQSIVNDFCINAGGWRIDAHPRFLADLTGDGRADIIGCGNAGVYVSLNNGSGTFGPVSRVVDNFGTAQGWQVDKHPRFIADLTGDGRGDIIGFGDAGVYVSYNNGSGAFQPARLILNDFGVQQGWSVQKHLRFPVDLTGDGCADIVGFGENSVWVSFNDGRGNLGPVRRLTDEFAFNGGAWSLDKTVRYVANLGAGRPL